MQLSEAALRQVLLAQSIERLDQERQLVSQPAIDQATAAACTQAPPTCQRPSPVCASARTGEACSSRMRKASTGKARKHKKSAK